MGIVFSYVLKSKFLCVIISSYGSYRKYISLIITEIVVE